MKLTQSMLRNIIKQQLTEAMGQQSLPDQVFKYLNSDEAVGTTKSIGELAQLFNASEFTILEILMGQEFEYWISFDDSLISRITIDISDQGFQGA